MGRKPLTKECLTKGNLVSHRLRCLLEALQSHECYHPLPPSILVPSVTFEGFPPKMLGNPAAHTGFKIGEPPGCSLKLPPLAHHPLYIGSLLLYTDTQNAFPNPSKICQSSMKFNYRKDFLSCLSHSLTVENSPQQTKNPQIPCLQIFSKECSKLPAHISDLYTTDSVGECKKVPTRMLRHPIVLAPSPEL